MGLLRSFALLATLAVLVLAAPTETSSSSPSAGMAAPASRAVAAEIPAKVDLDPKAQRAEELLGDLKEEYRHLEGVTVAIGATPNGEQAVAYYTDGEIVVSPTHQASLEDILAHEIWHIIDWRDNGRLDWAENVPPDDPSDYLR